MLAMMSPTLWRAAFRRSHALDHRGSIALIFHSPLLANVLVIESRESKGLIHAKAPDDDLTSTLFSLDGEATMCWPYLRPPPAVRWIFP
jgi:hypothetical protein